MKVFVTESPKLISDRKDFRVFDSKEKPLIRPRAKYNIVYPKTIMPDQASGYIKPKKNDCW